MKSPITFKYIPFSRIKGQVQGPECLRLEPCIRHQQCSQNLDAKQRLIREQDRTDTRKYERFLPWRLTAIEGYSSRFPVTRGRAYVGCGGSTKRASRRRVQTSTTGIGRRWPSRACRLSLGGDLAKVAGTPPAASAKAHSLPFAARGAAPVCAGI